MAREIAFLDRSLTGRTLYANLYRAGSVWDTIASAWVTPVAADLADYAVTMTEDAGTGNFTADLPAGIDRAGVVEVTILVQPGASPASDDPQVGAGELEPRAEPDEPLAKTMRLVRAVLLGEAAMATPAADQSTFRRKDGTTAAVVVSHDAVGNRTDVTIP